MTDRPPNHETAKPPNAYWRSLRELAADPALAQKLADEFEGYDPDEVTGFTRRSFVKLMGASMALAGLTLSGCRRWPEQKVMPYASRGRTPNTLQHYATMLMRGGVAHPLLVTTFDGRPIKVEGNPDHPIPRGASDAASQAAVLSLYDPHRTRQLTRRGERASWGAFADYIAGRMGESGQGVAVLCEANDSPALANVRAQLAEQRRDLSWYTWEPIHRDGETAASRAAFGRTLRPQYHLEKADVIVTLDADILGHHPASLKHARDWAAGRRSADGRQRTMNRMYAVEPGLSITGSVADYRLPTRAGRIGQVAAAILAGIKGLVPDVPNDAADFVLRVVDDLILHHGRALVAAGTNQPPQVHELAAQINAAVGAVGNTLTMIGEPDYELPMTQQIAQLVSAIKGGAVHTLLILGGNPVYDAPADLDFAAALDSLEHTAHLTLYPNETTHKCAWQLPRAHGFEAWGDGLAWDGSHCIAQPMIYPLFGGRSALQVAAMLAGEAKPDGERLVRAVVAGGETAWRSSVRMGFVEGSAGAAVTSAAPNVVTRTTVSFLAEEGFQVVFAPDASVGDGSLAENGWLQELPDPLTKITWDNAALMNIKDARELGIDNGDVIEITVADRSIRIAAYLMPGQARGTITMPLGYGRTAGGHIGTGVGFNAYPLRTMRAQYAAGGATIQKTARRYELATTTEHYLIDGIGTKLRRQRVGAKGGSGIILKEATLGEYRADPQFVHRGAHGDVRLQMYPMPRKFAEAHAWGMTIDMSACTGCSACVIACQSENNIPVVGKDQVLVGREMHWLRIDRYFKTDADDADAQRPDVVHMPMMCQHCENAPCEQVCPVAATTHDAEGLNVMVYNRCIGTRYCSNNCPYKVRRFNYFDFHAKDARGSAKPWFGMPDTEQTSQVDKVRQMVYNPDVTVRSRGVMEKCTYCVQRIARAKTEARIEQVARGEHHNRAVPAGAVVTACQQACPTGAIRFGNIADPHDPVAQTQKTNARAYDVLDELNTRPRTKYLALIRNREV